MYMMYFVQVQTLRRKLYVKPKQPRTGVSGKWHKVELRARVCTDPVLLSICPY